MTNTFEKTSTNHGVLTFSIDRETINKGLDQEFNRIKKQINAPGFRKGRVPRKIFDQRYGEEALYEKTLDIVLPGAYERAVKEAGVSPVVQPKIDVESIERGKDWVIKAELVLKPEVKLGDYKGLKVKKESPEVTDEEVDEKIEAERKKLAELVLKEDTPAVLGDTVVIDFDGSIDGVAFDGGKAENHSLELGSNQFIPGFEDQLVGLKAGDSIDVKVPFPEEYHAKDLAGKDAVFATTIHEVKSKELPELDDEFAKDIDDEVQTLDELKAKYRKQLEETKSQNVESQFEEEAIKQVVENAEIVELPEEMVHEEVHRMMDQFLAQVKQQGVSPEMYYQITGTTKDDLHQQYEKEANDKVRTNLVIEAVVAAENIDSTDEEVQEEIKTLSEEYNLPVEQVEKFLSKDMIEHDVKMKKALKVITESAVAE